ncbi:unnamed protein product [Rhizophagus irregularis]|nr:unnamed protein product [Rhizophagus irregularis]
MIEKEFNMFTTEEVELHEELKDDENIIRRMGLAYILKKPYGISDPQAPRTKSGVAYKLRWTKDGKIYCPGMKQNEQGGWYRPERRNHEERPRRIYEVWPYDSM